MLGLSHEEATDSPYIASMGVYCFKTEALLDLLTQRYPTSNDFGSEVIPAAIRDHHVQVRFVENKKKRTQLLLLCYPLVIGQMNNQKSCVGIHISRLLGRYWNYKDFL